MLNVASLFGKLLETCDANPKNSLYEAEATAIYAYLNPSTESLDKRHNKREQMVIARNFNTKFDAYIEFFHLRFPAK